MIDVTGSADDDTFDVTHGAKKAFVSKPKAYDLAAAISSTISLIAD